MNPSGSGDPVSESPLFKIWTELATDAQRAEFLAENPEFGNPALVEELCAEAARHAKSDLEQSMRLGRAAERLAHSLADELGRGRALRALANASHLKGRYHESADLYAKALGHFQSNEGRREEAVTRSSALHNLIYLGDYERARDWAARARSIFEELGDQLRLARLDLNYANLLFRNDRWEEALSLYESAYSAFREVGDAQDLAACLSNQATCLISLSRFFQALQVYRQARQLCIDRDLPLLSAEIEYNIAYLHFLRGDHTRALEQYQAARIRAGELDDQLHLGLCDLDQSEIYIELNLVEEAIVLASRAYERFVLLGLKYESAKALANLAIGNSRQGKAFLALDLLGKARAAFVLEGNQIWPAVLDLYQASILFSEGRLFEAARLARLAREAFEIASVPSKRAACEILLARVAIEVGDADAAAHAADAAFGLLRSLNLPALSYQAYLVLGQAEEARGNPERARQAYEAAEVWLERLQSHRQPEDLKIGFSSDRLLVFESLVSIAAEQNSGIINDEAGRRIFDLAERAKARNLANLIAFRASALPAKATSRSALVGDIRSLREELNWYYRQIDLGQMAVEETARNRVGPLRETSRRQEQKLVQTLREVRVHDQEFAALQDAGTVALESIQGALAPNTLLLAFYVARGAVFGTLLSGDTLHTTALSLVSRTRDLHRDVQFELSKFVTGRHEGGAQEVPDDAGVLVPLKALYDELIAPIENRIDRENLVIVPHAHMHYLPFHALFDGAEFLGDRLAISYAPSATAYHQCRIKTVESENRALFLDAAGRSESTFSRLLSTLERSESRAEALTGNDATRRAFEEASATHRIIHVAAGSRHRDDNSMFSTIEFPDSNMSLFDLYSLRSSADLIVVTGCGRGLDVLTEADDRLALAHGLLYAGAKAVILDLWQVEPESSADLWQDFYGRLAAGERVGAAFTQATRRHRRNLSHPFDWASVVLVGDPG